MYEEESDEDSLAGYVWSEDDNEEEDYWSGEDNDWCHLVNLQPPPAKRARRTNPDENPVQEGGSIIQPQPVFEFDLRRAQLPRRWRNTVEKHRYSGKLRQQRNPTEDDNLGYEVADAIQRALNTSLEEQNLQPQDRVHFTLQSEAFSAANNHCFQSTQFNAQDVATGTPRFNTYKRSRNNLIQVNLSRRKMTFQWKSQPFACQELLQEMVKEEILLNRSPGKQSNAVVFPSRTKIISVAHVPSSR